jgi:hypothetical protein
MFLANREESFLYQGPGPMGHILPAEKRKIQGGWGGGGTERSRGCVVFVFEGVWQFYVEKVLDYGVHIAYTCTHSNTSPPPLYRIKDYSQSPFL